jgi:predicted XRE-type DNA-binding protein
MEIKPMNQEIEVYTSCGNVFADLGFDNAEEMLVKAELVRKINDIIIDRQLTELEIAKTLEVELQQVSHLMSGKLLSFSLENLLKFLNILGQDIEIKISTTPKNNSKGTVLVNIN